MLLVEFCLYSALPCTIYVEKSSRQRIELRLTSSLSLNWHEEAGVVVSMRTALAANNFISFFRRKASLSFFLLDYKVQPVSILLERPTILPGWSSYAPDLIRCVRSVTVYTAGDCIFVCNALMIYRVALFVSLSPEVEARWVMSPTVATLSNTRLSVEFFKASAILKRLIPQLRFPNRRESYLIGCWPLIA